MSRRVYGILRSESLAQRHSTCSLLAGWYAVDPGNEENESEEDEENEEHGGAARNKKGQRVPFYVGP